MIKRVIQLLFAPIGGAIGYWLWVLIETALQNFDIQLWGWAAILCEIACISVFAVTGYFFCAGRAMEVKPNAKQDYS